MHFPKYNYPVTWRRTNENILRLCDDYGSFGAVSFTQYPTKETDITDIKPTSYKFNFKRICGKHSKSNYVATSTTLPLLHPEEDPGIVDVSIKDLFQNTTKNQRTVRRNRAFQQARYFIENYPDIAFETSLNFLQGCFRTKNKARKNQVYKKMYKNSVLPVVVGVAEHKKMQELLGDVLNDIPPDLLQTMLHEEIEILSKKIVNNALYKGGCIAYQTVNNSVGIIVSACGPPLDVLKIQPVTIKTSSTTGDHDQTSRSAKSTPQTKSNANPKSVQMNLRSSSTMKSTSLSKSQYTASTPTTSALHSPNSLEMHSQQKSELSTSTDHDQVSGSAKSTPASLKSFHMNLRSRSKKTPASKSPETASTPKSPTSPFMESLQKSETINNNADFDYEIVTKKEPHLFAFQGVIRQIVCTRAATQEIVYVGIRTDYHCHILKVEMDTDRLKFQILHTAEFQHQPLYIALSPFIPGECVITLENGEVNLLTTDSGVVKQIPAMFEGFAGSIWRQCHFGSHPRLLVSTEHKKVDLIDVMDTANLKETNLFQLPSVHVIQSEDILVTKQHPTNYFLHFVATHHQLFMFDERLPQTPMLAWNHLLMTPPHYIDVFSPVNVNHVVVIASYASCEAHCFQFELDESHPPSVIGPGWTVASVSGWFSLLPSLPSTSHVYDAAKLRLEKPFIGVCIMAHHSNEHPGYTVLMTNSLGDVFHQTYISGYQNQVSDKTLNVGPGCPDIKLNQAELKKCYDWLDALSMDYERKPLNDDCLVDVEKSNASVLYNEINAEVQPDSGCPFCCKEPITNSRYGQTSPSKCSACGLNPEISFNLMEKYFFESCVVTRQNLGMSDEEPVDDIIGDDLHVNPGGVENDEVGHTLWNLWKGTGTDNESISAKKLTIETEEMQAVLADTIDTLDSETNKGKFKTGSSQLPLSQESIDLFSQPNSQPQEIRSVRKRKRPAKSVMGF